MIPSLQKENPQQGPGENSFSEPDSLRSLNSFLLITLALIYLVVRFGFTQTLDSLGTYASYIFEVECVVIALILQRKNILEWLAFKGNFTRNLPLALASGFAIFKLAQIFGIVIPFDLRSREIIFFLLAVAPILEELLFRFLLWKPIQILTRRPVMALLGTSLLFSYSHLHAIWFVPEEFHRFVVFQTVYTLFLAFVCGHSVYKHRSLSGAMALHFAFNLGFFLASFV